MPVSMEELPGCHIAEDLKVILHVGPILQQQTLLGVTVNQGHSRALELLHMLNALPLKPGFCLVFAEGGANWSGILAHDADLTFPSEV